MYTINRKSKVLRIEHPFGMTVWSVDTHGFSPQLATVSEARIEHMCNLLNNPVFQPPVILVHALAYHPVQVWTFEPVLTHAQALTFCRSLFGFVQTDNRITRLDDINNIYWSKYHPFNIGNSQHGGCYLLPHAPLGGS